MDWFPVCRDGGLDRYFYDNISAFSSQGVTGTALVSYAEPQEIGSISVRGIATERASLLARCCAVRRLASDALLEGVDIVGSHFALYTFPWLRRIPRHTPLVVNFHGPWSEEMRFEARTAKRRFFALLARSIERAVYRRADLFITLSEAFRDLLHGRYSIPLSRIRVVPGGVDLQPYLLAPSRSSARHKLGWPENRRIVIAVRRLARRMGLEALIDAMQIVRRTIPDALLLIGGKGSERERLEARVMEQGLGGNIRLLGFIPEEELPLAYAAADLSVVPTVALEGFGLVTVESLASGTPVIGSAIGGTREILRSLDSALVFDTSTPEVIAGRICAALDGAITLPSRESCRAFATRFGWAGVVPQLLDVYQEAIEQTGARK